MTWVLLLRGLLLAASAAGLWAADDALAKLLHLPIVVGPLVLDAAAIMLAMAAVQALARPVVAAVYHATDALDRWGQRATASSGTFVSRVVTALPLTLGAAALMILARTAFAGAEARLIDGWYSVMFPRVSQAEAALDTGVQRAAGVRDDVVIVDMDDESLQRLGFPFPRKYYAQLMDVLRAAGARSVVFDVTFQDPSLDHPEWDQMMGKTAKRVGGVYVAYPMVSGAGEHLPADIDAALARNALPLPADAHPWLIQWEDLSGEDQHQALPVAPLTLGVEGMGAINVLLDEDDIMRHGTVVYRVKDRLYPALVTRVAMDAMGLQPQDVQLQPHALLLGNVRVPLDAKGRTLLRFHGRPGDVSHATFRYIPFHSVIQREYVFRIQDNPLGDDPFLLSESAVVKVDGKRVPLDEVDPARIARGTLVVGKADISRGAGKVLEIEFLSRPGQPQDVLLDMVDEANLQFTAILGDVQTKGASPDLFRGKHVLVGASATGAMDLRTTPVGQAPGVEVQATLLNNLLSNDMMRHAPEAYAWGVVLLLALLLALLAGVGVPAITALGSAVAGLGYVLVAFGMFSRQGIHMELLPPLGTVVAGFAAVLLQGYRRESADRARVEESREFIRHTFGRYLTDQVVDSLLSSPEGLSFGGERRTVTIMMTDLRGFTAMSAKLTPESVVKILNNYLSVMTDIVVKHGGTIDEFIGDAILVVFGAPVTHGDDAARAVACAVEMLVAMPRVNAWNKQNDLPEVAMGIGINTGEVVVGNIGSEKRAKYAIVGTPINVCARVESYTVGGQVFISDDTRQAAGEVLDIRDSMTVSPKGIPKPITIHDIRGVKGRFNVFLSEEAEELHELPQPATFRFTVLAGKHAGTDTHDAVVRVLSMQGMEVESAVTLDALDNVKGQVLDDAGQPLAGDLYGKVIRSAGGGLTYIRFTSLSDAHKAHLEKAHRAAVVAEHPPQGVPVA